MKKILFLIFVIGLLVSCQSAKDAFTLKKKSSADEFLIEKKSPLVLPPNYGELPLPGNQEIVSEDDNENEIEIILSDNKNLSTSSETNLEPTSIEKSILEKIK